MCRSSLVAGEFWYTVGMSIRRTLPLLIALFGAAGCSSQFTIVDAAQRIAFTQGCEQVDVTLVEGYSGGYEATGCGERLTYRCSDGQCIPAEDARPNPTAQERSRTADAALAELEERIVGCVGGELPVTVQVRFDESGQVSPPLLTRPRLSGQAHGCVGAAALSVHISPASGELLVSHTYGEASSTDPAAE